jgi:hypothetical protein
MSLLTCVGDLEVSKTLLCGLQYSNSNSLQDMEGDLDKGQRGYVSHHLPFGSNYMRFLWI